MLLYILTQINIDYQIGDYPVKDPTNVFWFEITSIVLGPK